MYDNDTSEWRHAVVTSDELIYFLGVSHEETKPCLSVLLAPETISRLLHEAGAPKPWRQLTMLVGRIDRYYQIKNKGASEEVRKAIDTLRRHLPETIADLTRKNATMAILAAQEAAPSPVEILLRRSLGEHQASLGTLLLAANAAAFFHGSTKGPAAHWHYDAQTLLHVYRSIVQTEGGTSKEGPAVRFVQSALLELTGIEHTPDAIAKAFQTMG